MAIALRIGAASEAPALAAGWATHAVSLLDPGSAPVAVLADRHLVLRFEDAERADAVGPGAAHVAELLRFTAELGDRDRLVVHCVAGLSRSTAAAMAILVQHGATADDALARVWSLRPDMWPNERLCRHADDALSTGGALIAAIRRWHRLVIERHEASDGT